MRDVRRNVVVVLVAVQRVRLSFFVVGLVCDSCRYNTLTQKVSLGVVVGPRIDFQAQSRSRRHHLDMNIVEVQWK